MEMIAASKMKRAQEARGLQGRPYAEKIEQVIAIFRPCRKCV
jgi:F0F1-type ATP synthase gamma subunit